MNTDLNPNPLVRFLGKPCCDFTRADLIRYVKENGIEMINLRYPGADGRLKTLNFVINDEAYLESILTCGERVDGSSLFPYIEAGSSDLYVVPRYRTAFRNPFSEIPSLDILCSYYTKDGEPFDMAPEQALRRAHEELRRVTGFDFHVMGELEFYVVSPKVDLFLAADQRGYHESTPFNKAAEFRMRAMQYIAQAGGEIKYGHSEVGNFTQEGLMYEQNEIEFLPTDLEAAADQLLVAKWIIRTLAYEYGVDVTFAPKITVGKAGSGLHINLSLTMDGKNLFEGDIAPDSIPGSFMAGILRHSRELTAFTNPLPNSYLRFGCDEAPRYVSWSRQNRSQLVRIPQVKGDNCRMELRSPDPACNPYLAIGLVLAAGLDGIENRMELSAPVNRNLFIPGEAAGLGLETLPASLEEAVEVARNSEFLHKFLPDELSRRYYAEALRRCEALKNASDPAEYERVHYFNAI